MDRKEKEEKRYLPKTSFKSVFFGNFICRRRGRRRWAFDFAGFLFKGLNPERFGVEFERWVRKIEVKSEIWMSKGNVGRR